MCLASALLLFVAVASAAPRAVPPAKTAEPSPLEATWAIRAWSQSWLAHEGRQLDDLEKLRRILDLLTREGELAIHEITEPTPTAGEAFQSRRADCVGFA